MNDNDEWIVVVAPLPLEAARATFEQWKVAHPNSVRLGDDDIRIDLIRTTSGDRVRYLVRADSWRRISNEMSG